MIKIMIISLPEAAERRAYMRKQLDSLGVEYEFFSALRGNPELGANLNYDLVFREKIFGRQMSAGEIGCYLSHQELWHQIGLGDRPVCIMEDDVKLSAGFKAVLAKLSDYSNYDILRLAGLFPKKCYKWGNFKGLKLVKYWRDPLGTQCYLITPHAARKLYFLAEKIRMPVDDFMANYGYHGLNVVGIDSYVLEHDWSVPSQLGERQDQKKKMLPWQKIRRETYKQLQSSKSLWTQFNYYLKALSQK